MKTRFAMVIDSSRCFNCRACLVSCQLTNGVPPFYLRNWIKHGPAETGARVHFQPGNCMQCDRPICVEACPTRATFRDTSDGVVKVNTELCIGCGSCIPACPYGARYRHPVRRVVDKCDFCLRSRVPLGKPPACVETCPTRARVFGNILDPAAEASRLLRDKKTVRVVNQKTNTEPAIYYLGYTSPTDWPVEAKAPVPIQLWRDLFNPAVKGLVGLTALGVLVMFGKQLLSSDEKKIAETGRDPGREEGNGNEND